MRQNNTSRPAFTLVELLVAAGIIALLLGLVAISYPSINEREQLTRAVDKLRTGLLTARLWARRDQVTTGIRWNSDASQSGGGATGLFYIQQPMQTYDGNLEPYSSNPFSMLDPTRTKLKFRITNPLNDGKNIDPFERIKKVPAKGLFPSADYLVLESDLPHRILNFSSSPNSWLGEIQLFSPIAQNFEPVFGHLCRIVRSPEDIPLQEETLFGDNIRLIAPSNAPITFLPTGQVFNSSFNQVVLTLAQTKPDGSTETADVTLDCLSGTTRYQNP